MLARSASERFLTPRKNLTHDRDGVPQRRGLKPTAKFNRRYAAKNSAPARASRSDIVIVDVGFNPRISHPTPASFP